MWTERAPQVQPVEQREEHKEKENSDPQTRTRTQQTEKDSMGRDFILAGGHVRASAGALAVHTALIPCACLSGHKLLSHHATNRDQVCFCRQVSTR